MTLNAIKTSGALLLTVVSTCTFAMDVNFEFKRNQQCSSVSPAIKVTGVPVGTTELSMRMNDIDNRFKNHGGGSIQSTEGFSETVEIPEGALKSYAGPCPPNFSSFGHDYILVVEARNKAGVIENASKTKTFSSKEVKD